MPHRLRGPLPWLALAFAGNVAAILAATYGMNQGVVDREELNALAMMSVAGSALMFVLAWKIVDVAVMRAIKRMAADVRAVAHGGNRTEVDVARYDLLKPCPSPSTRSSPRWSRPAPIWRKD